MLNKRKILPVFALYSCAVFTTIYLNKLFITIKSCVSKSQQNMKNSLLASCYVVTILHLISHKI